MDEKSKTRYIEIPGEAREDHVVLWWIDKKTGLACRREYVATDSLFFPDETLEWMIGKIDPERESKGFMNPREILEKLETVKTFASIGKKNRWFAYYQAMGEIEGWWTLDDVTDRVRSEKTRWNRDENEH